MNIITSSHAHQQIKSCLESLGSVESDVPGSFWIMTDDGCTIAVICAYEKEMAYSFSLLQSVVVEVQMITPYVYVIVESESAYANQVLSIQELGAFAITVPDMQEYIPSFIKFVSKPKRRQEKSILPPKRDLRMFTTGEQLLLTIPGIGERKARDLLRMFGSVAWAFAQMTQEDTPDIINIITADDVDNFRNALQLDDNMILSVIMKEDK